MFLQASVILSTGGLPQCMLRYHTPPGPSTPQTRHPTDQEPPWGQAPPQTRHHTDQAPPQADPPAQSMLGDTVNARAVRILLECNLVLRLFLQYFDLYQTFIELKKQMQMYDMKRDFLNIQISEIF